MSDRILLQLFRRFPSKSTIFTQPEGRAEREYEHEAGWPFYWWFDRDDLFVGKKVLELGCGYGGSTVRFLEYGPESVVGVEIGEHMIESARDFANQMNAHVSFRLGSDDRIPAEDGEFDLVTMYDVLEHVVSPRNVLNECFRVLKPRGELAIVFPPYYALRGGSHLGGYATRIPGLNLLFTTRQLRSAALKMFAEREIDYQPFLRDVPSDKLWNLNGLTARRFGRIIYELGFEREELHLTSHFEFRRQNGTMAPLAAPLYWGFRGLANLPLLREVFCERIVALLRRPA